MAGSQAEVKVAIATDDDVVAARGRRAGSWPRRSGSRRPT